MLNPNISEVLKQGGAGVMPTDTIYGIAASALNKKAIERLYQLRRRKPTKPFIILISSLGDLERFDVSLSEFQKEFLKKVWPGAVSVVLPCESPEFEYLHRGTKTLAFRFPADLELVSLLIETGPLAAPSANIEGHPPAQTIHEARAYFGAEADFYEDAGKLLGQASTLLSLVNDSVAILRQGAVKIEANEK